MDSKREFPLLDSKERALALQNEKSIFMNVSKFEQMNRVATMLAQSDFVPSGKEASFKGNVGNCLIALDLADRMNIHWLMLMQSMYVVHGRPGFEGKFCSALINNSARYKDPLEYEWKKDKDGHKIGCRAFAVRKATGKTIKGPWVTWKMVVAEGWDKPKGTMKSKWITMPELMYMYRAASFFIKTNDSDLLMGMQTLEELEDTHATLIQQPDGSYSTGKETHKTADLYKPDRISEEQKKDEPDNTTDTGPGPSGHGGRDDQGAETGPEAENPWDRKNWINIRLPKKLREFALANAGSFKDQAQVLRNEFTEKCVRMMIEPLFDDDGNLIQEHAETESQQTEQQESVDANNMNEHGDPDEQPMTATEHMELRKKQDNLDRVNTIFAESADPKKNDARKYARSIMSINRPNPEDSVEVERFLGLYDQYMDEVESGVGE